MELLESGLWCLLSVLEKCCYYFFNFFFLPHSVSSTSESVYVSLVPSKSLTFSIFFINMSFSALHCLVSSNISSSLWILSLNDKSHKTFFPQFLIFLVVFFNVLCHAAHGEDVTAWSLTLKQWGVNQSPHFWALILTFFFSFCRGDVGVEAYSWFVTIVFYSVLRERKRNVYLNVRFLTCIFSPFVWGVFFFLFLCFVLCISC